MSYYPSQTGQHPATPGAYPYGAYQPFPQTPGAYPYQAGAYPATAVTGYGTTAWPYSYYNYQAAQHAHAATARPSITTQLSTTQVAGQSQASASTPRPTFTAYTPVYPRETVAAAATGGATGRAYRKQSNFKGLFTKELRSLMYGFGDDRNPANDTVNVMEEILVEYIADICQTALAPTKKSRLQIEDFRKVLSRPADAKKLARMEELLFMQEVIKRARSQFDDTGIDQTNPLQS
ncbi:TFIID-18kDa-domain-containing protein [Auriscalpium vulgare]|uniref:TFIID-18kDa-domain-containing protein n=1 Tax=Auriscalpium vulgare TaxID=40419 RepID=A0ACB8SC97_9AGAM|nr:TFIID-18kDa-domain-containing protein [Auriscalpium vulgare]